MNTVRLGKTNITSIQNGFGALPIQRISKEKAGELLRSAYDAGFTYFDTARAYTDSEEKIGYAMSDIRSGFQLATKTQAKTADRFWDDLHTSLKMLKTDHIDVYQFHNPDFCPKPDDGTGLYEAALEAKRQGKILHIGITNHRPWIAEEAVRSDLYETLQFPFNYLATKRDMDIVNLCREHDVGFIAMKGLSGGLLSNSTAAYAWIRQYDTVLPIWGVQRMHELKEFISFIEQEPEMTEELQNLIETDRKELIGSFCRSCGYCMPCPQGIEIYQCARMSQLIRRSPSAQYLTPEWQEKMRKINNCLHCNQCKSKCPYELDTPKLLEENLKDYERILSGEVQI